MSESAPKKRKTLAERRASVHYVNNKEFSEAVDAYNKSVIEAENSGDEAPQITEYIGSCFLKIAEGLSHKPNFIRYTYREEMVMDAVENCIRYIKNFRIDAETRTKQPNAFAYFTQMSYFAFLRRIAKEKRQQDIKQRFIERSNVGDFMTESEHTSGLVHGTEEDFLESLKVRRNRVKYRDEALKDFKKAEKKGLEKFCDD